MWGVLLYRTLNYKNITLIFTIRLHSTPKCFDLKHFEKLINWLPGTVLIMMLNFWYHQQFEKSRVPIQPWHIHTAKLPVIHSVDQTIFTNSIWICINWKHFVKPCWWSNKSFEKKASCSLIFGSVKGCYVFSYTLHIFCCQSWLRLFVPSKFDIFSVIKRNHRITAIGDVCNKKLEQIV